MKKQTFILISLAIVLIGVTGIILTVKHEIPELRDTTSLTINVCEPPYNAVPDDTISDIAAFQLAVDVIQSLKIENIFDSLDVRLIVPPGTYIFDEDFDGKGVKADFMARYPTINMTAPGTTLSGMTIYQAYR